MTKEAYFEMCEALKSEPLEHEIPIDFNDFPYEIQLAFNVYWKLKDKWDGFSGSYLGKEYTGIIDLFTILDIDKEDRKLYYELVNIIDHYRSKIISQKQQQKKSLEKP